VNRMTVTRRGTLRYENGALFIDGWVVSGGGRCFANRCEVDREFRTAVMIEVARAAGVYLEPMELDMTAFSYAPCLRHEREARDEIDRIRAAVAPRRPWWRFWR
jgi:hypothetical protein